MRAPSNNRISQTSHGTSKAVDYSASPDIFVYAPENATFDSYQQRGSGTNDAGNALRIRGPTGLHQFAHLEECYVRAGQPIAKGQKIAKMGYTGYTKPSGPRGRHLHYWVQTPSGYVYPPNLVNESFNAPSGGGGDMATDTQIDKTISYNFQIGFGRAPTDTDFNTWRPLFKNNYAEAELELMRQIDISPAALKNKTDSGENSVELRPGLYRVKKEL